MHVLVSGGEQFLNGTSAHNRLFSTMVVSGGPSQFLQGAKNCNFEQNFSQGSQMAAYYSTMGGIWEIKIIGVNH